MSDLAKNHVKFTPFLFVFLLGVGIWFIPTPEGLQPEAWQLFAVFVATIVGIIISPLPMGAMAILGIAVCVLTNTLQLSDALSGFSSNVTWLIVFAFFISRAFIKTGLGERIAYYFISKLGRSTLGLSYGLVFTEFVLAPMTPSSIARGGGMIFPIAQSLAKSYVDESHKQGSTKTGAYIMQVCFHSNVITCSLFLTAMAGNPLIVSLAASAGIEITWMSWATFAIVPGFINLLVMPLVLYTFHPPKIKHSEEAPKIAKQKLEELGPLRLEEIIMLSTFTLLIGLWILGPNFGISATTTALIGFCIMLLTGLLTWDEAISEKGAWKTFIWFGSLSMMSAFLAKLGMMGWIGTQMQALLSGYDAILAVTILGLSFFLVHYLFASITAQIAAMYGTLLLVFLGFGVPPFLAAMSLGFLSILSGGLTHYSIGSAPIYFGAGYLNTKTWWKLGAVMGITNLLVWSTVGSAWWKFLGWW